MKVNLADLEEAFTYVSASHEGEFTAYINRQSGEIHYLDPDDDDPPPGNLDDPDQYAEVPHRDAFDLGSRLVFRFAATHVPESAGYIRQLFARKGGYGRFKDWLARNGKREAWFAFEAEAIREALREWCAGIDLEVAEPGAPR